MQSPLRRGIDVSFCKTRWCSDSIMPWNLHSTRTSPRPGIDIIRSGTLPSSRAGSYETEYCGACPLLRCLSPFGDWNGVQTLGHVLSHEWSQFVDCGSP